MDKKIKLILETAKEQMGKSIVHLEKELIKIRAGKANPSMLNGVFVEYYGSQTPLQQISNISTLDARTISIQSWEKNQLENIERAIINANLGLTPMNNGDLIMINVPALTEERRKELVKRAKILAEDARIGIRNVRKDANSEVRKLKEEDVSDDEISNTEIDIQDLTNRYIKKVENILELKEKDIMTL